MKNCEMILAGFGGQGILFTGKILAFAAMLGGTANCHVIIDDEPIGSPIVTRPNILVAMNKPSLDKFENTVSASGESSCRRRYSLLSDNGRIPSHISTRRKGQKSGTVYNRKDG